ncbi:MAG: selenocysteine-specific translation elongation factor [Candidatus Eisenbacteria bacterium]|jgi:selenocysteine-specific elongation factor|nr:selenocysteine-specific translation elongation factor [Candidatus Eisenbacteria bacterium]
MIIGTAGHIDHGKSTLVTALTGINPDRLKEEQLRGITIDLGFAHLALPGGAVAGIVDVPGHERLVHNMLAGAGGMDLAMVVVAGDEGVKPQTIEHVEILDLLGIPSGIGVITKTDLVGPDERAVARLELEELLDGTSLAGSPIVEVSATTGDGIAELQSLLADLAARHAERPVHRPFRLPLDRVFTLQGFGTVVTGTATAGRVAVGQSLDVVPTGEEVRVRSIEVHGARRDEARAGERVALNIAGRKLHCERGFALTEPGVFRGTDCLDCRVRMLRAASAKRHRSLTCRVFLGTAEVLARIVPLEDGVLTRRGEGYVQIRAREPIPAARGDRFVLRSEDDQATLGGGIVIDAFTSRHGPRRGATARALMALDRVPDEVAFGAFLATRPEGSTLLDMARLLNLTSSSLGELASAARAAGTAVISADGARHLARSTVERLSGAIVDAVAEFHQANPMKPAMPVSELRSRFEPRLLSAVETALGTLQAAGVMIVEGGALRHRDHAVAFDEVRERTRQSVMSLYEHAGLQPPARNDVASALASQGLSDVPKVLDSLLETGDLVALSHELLVPAQVIEAARSRLLPYLRAPDGVSVGQAREILGTTRKYAVPLFELFDRQGFTVRRGDVRILSPAWGVSRHDAS